MSDYIAHYRRSDGQLQTLETHLIETSELAESFTKKIGLPAAGELIGLLHDFGKYSQAFQDYIGSATGMLNPDCDDNFVNADELRGKIDHSSAGAQWIRRQLDGYGETGDLLTNILSLCIASHHSGLIDCLDPSGQNSLQRRLNKADAKTFFQECVTNAPVSFVRLAKDRTNRDLLAAMSSFLAQIAAPEQHAKLVSKKVQCFYIGMFVRFLFSCLIDADRINSADFENPENKRLRQSSGPVHWAAAIDRAEEAFSKLPTTCSVDPIRNKISAQCKARAKQDRGIYSLTVPTGGGKTYASLRYALHHAEAHKLDRIIFVIPFTSVIDQNAAAIREILEREGDQIPWVLEHHSNLEPYKQTWHSKLTSANWDSPIVLTTMVQYLEVLFGGGTRSVRRMHQLANSLIIFDEIQTLPVKCVHLFCNSLNFLTAHAQTSALLCTATQPLLGKLKHPEKGELRFAENADLVGNIDEVNQLFSDLERVRIDNQYRVEGWSEEDIAELAILRLTEFGSCLAIVNTKSWAKSLFQICAKTVDSAALFHLSTSMCPKHREQVLRKVRNRLIQDEPTLCISTQLIEAGVDVDFASGIRFFAGLDSIAQAAGRCNRNGKSAVGIVTIINPADEKIDLLEDIKEGCRATLRVLDEEKCDDLLSPEVMKRYFNYYFYSRSDQMDYPINLHGDVPDDSILNLLSDNPLNSCPLELTQLRHSFMTAGAFFKTIDAPTQALIVPYQAGQTLIAKLCGLAVEFDPKKYRTLLRQAQQYSVNVFPNVWKALLDQGAIHEIQEEGIFFLDSEYYEANFGVSTERTSHMPTWSVDNDS